jgi:hypothetical protein
MRGDLLPSETLLWDLSLLSTGKPYRNHRPYGEVDHQQAEEEGG